MNTKGEFRKPWIVVSLRLHNGNIDVEKDGIEYSVAEDLIEAGVAREDIIYDFDSFKPQKESDQTAA